MFVNSRKCDIAASVKDPGSLVLITHPSLEVWTQLHSILIAGECTVLIAVYAVVPVPVSIPNSSGGYALLQCRNDGGTGR